MKETTCNHVNYTQGDQSETYGQQQERQPTTTRRPAMKKKCWRHQDHPRYHLNTPSMKNNTLKPANHDCRVIPKIGDIFKRPTHFIHIFLICCFSKDRTYLKHLTHKPCLVFFLNEHWETGCCYIYKWVGNPAWTICLGFCGMYKW